MCESMVERVARAIDGCFDKPSPRLVKGMSDSEVRAIIADQLAVAAIKAMREPTDAMVSVTWFFEGESASAAYTAMIDAALNEQVAG